MCLAGLVALFFTISAHGVYAMLLVPMDGAQSDHLKAYGIVYHALKRGTKAYWLLNYRGGSFALDESREAELAARRAGVAIEAISSADYAGILDVIEESNMEKVTLEKAPRIAVYTPPAKLPWDDAVTLALTYADIPYDKIYDRDVVSGGLAGYDWLHLHHEDFTGQYSKFYKSFHTAAWYQRQKMELEGLAKSLGFEKVTRCKKAVALAIREYVERGGFLFAMCCAPNTLDIALAALGTDIAEAVFDGDPVDPHYRQKLDFGNCFAFENFEVQTSAMASYFGNIDVNLVNTPMRKPALDFELFPFSAKLDPVPTMLNQNHVSRIKGYYGLATSFNKDVMKKSVVVLGSVPGTQRVKYMHGVRGKGMFAFLGGHDPEDYSHAVGDEPTMLELHRNSPGYRLILNNVLFPAAEKKEKKT
ncbi:MAG: asparagine synthetase B [Chitinivibrionales bacterium]|nr:asparagine synthetase B [Chitinivibrionales bacterium]MBD3394343.1 asparagine synthetase B [Chitinivibrionales bacterium]